jgi:3-phenylpropionate/trans-cinnamate dioxygenase ferredoxin subunit
LQSLRGFALRISQKKFVAAECSDQHARGVRSPEFRERVLHEEIPRCRLVVRYSLVLGIWRFSISAMAHVTIETIKNGPYIVKGEVELIDADGNKFPVEKRMALCRCGASTEKPFCDGTHSKIGFQAAEKAVPESKE